jgi:uncharacterized FAD-dependent dehydrogenase
LSTPDTSYRFVAHAPANLPRRPIVIGTGPCGLFAGLILAQMGFRPIILDRGKAVRERTKDTWDLWRKASCIRNPTCSSAKAAPARFPTASCGARSSDPQHHGRKVLTEFVKAGAPEEILYVSKPHIGTFRLVTMVEKMRATSNRSAARSASAAASTDLLIDTDAKGKRHVRGVTLHGGEQILRRSRGAGDRPQRARHLRDAACAACMEAKPFSIGFRVEHPQSIIDRARFGPQAGHPILGAADYKLVHHATGNHARPLGLQLLHVPRRHRGGGNVRAGPRRHQRHEPVFAQRAQRQRSIVVGIDPVDFAPFDTASDKSTPNPLAGIALQRALESHAYTLGGENYNAPGQLVGDFIAARASREFGEVEPSFKPGVTLGSLDSALPAYAIEAIREALPAFDRQIKGFALHDAVLTGVETRTSSPVRIKRDDSFQSLNTTGLYPAGEGAGYAGGILSAAVDGIKVAEAVALSIATRH